MIRLAVPASQLVRREAYRSLAGDIPLCFLAGLLGNDWVLPSAASVRNSAAFCLATDPLTSG